MPQPLNPFLRAFFRSALPGQCSPVHHHVLLVPTTDVLLNSKDRETGTPYADLASTEEFLASHVLRVPGGVPPGSGNDAGAGGNGNARESKSKAKQYSTINGRTVVLKETFVYSNKGFKTLNQAQLLQDFIYYPDTLDGQQWLVYYISRPLLGSFMPIQVPPAVISDEPSKERKKLLTEASAGIGASTGSSSSATSPVQKKKEIKSFSDLLTNFPMISRQMQNGLERIIREFLSANETPIAKRTSRRSSFSSQNSSRTGSASSIKSSLSGGNSTVHPTSLELEPEEETMRTSLETALMAAINLFQSVDKAQLSLLGANTELTGPGIERMIERYFTEQIHDQRLFPRICAIRGSDDSDLQSKIRKMADIDIAQVGIPIEDGMKGKRELATRLAKGVETFRKMGVASCPQEMLELLLATQKVITETPSSGSAESSDAAGQGNDAEKPSAALTINADILVSMLLIVVIRSGVRHLHSRLLCMRYFIFTDEVESGEQGYALATLEAVLAHLTNASTALRRASKRNRLLWQAVKTGDAQVLEAVLQPEFAAHSETTLTASPILSEDESSDDENPVLADITNKGPERLSTHPEDSSFMPVNGSLEHVFPFQKPPTPPPEQIVAKAKKRVSMASLPRSHSVSSGLSSPSHSRQLSTDSALTGAVSDDLSTDKLAQTQDADGKSILMMAVEASRADSLKLLLSMPAHFRAQFVLDDVDGQGTTLLNSAMQIGNNDVLRELMIYLEETISQDSLAKYFASQDSKGRCMAHYLFNQPYLIRRFGKMLPWRLKDKNGQTPLFALCRSYDHEQYHAMADAAIAWARETQGDSEPLHLDDHVDAKGNTLLHIVNDSKLTLKLLHHCDADANAANDKRFTPLMVSSKYGRIDLVRTLFADPRVDITLKDLRGLTAVELAKDDDVRNRIDDLVLLSTPSTSKDGRVTTVVRSFLVEDATVRMVLKSGAPNANGLITVTTCRRSIADFENLAKWLAIECPASWLPTHFNLPSPFLIPSKPSRAVLRDVQLRLDNFFRSLMAHTTFSTHELVWEFFLVPEIDEPMLLERSKRKAEARVDNVKDDYEPLTDKQEVEIFVSHAREQMRGLVHHTKRAIRAVNRQRMAHNDFTEAQNLSSARFSTLLFLPASHIRACERYTRTLGPSEASPLAAFYYALHSVHSTATAVQVSLDRPAYLIGSMAQTQRGIARAMDSLSRSNRWTPNLGGLFDDAKRQAESDAWGKAAKARAELETLGCELRYTQQTVASELAGWQEEHVRAGKAMLRVLARDTVVRERARLEGMQRALREIRKAKA